MRREQGWASAATGVAAWALPWVARVLGAAALAAAGLGVEWLGARVLGVVAFVGQALVTLWLGFGGFRPKGREVDLRSALWAVPWTAAATVIVVTDLGRVEYDGGPSNPDTSVYDAIAHRVEAHDVPPVAVYVAAVAAALMTVACLALALASWLHRRGDNDDPPPARTGAKAAGVTSAVLVCVSLVVGVGMHARADRSAESDSLTHTVTRPADRQDDAPGPAEPTAEAWRHEITDDRDEMTYGTGAAVPGWDLMIARGQLRSSGITALSTRDGAELWRYDRAWLEPAVVTVDPDQGRVLLVDGNAAVVLDLHDGSEVAIRQLPDSLSCLPVTDDPTGNREEHEGAVLIGTVAVATCDGAQPTLAVFEVSTGRLLNSANIPNPGGCGHAALVGSTPEPVILRWGWRPGCGKLTLLVPDTPSGGFHRIPVELPETGASQRCRSQCDVRQVVAGDDTIVLTIGDRARSGQGDQETEILALDTSGELRWRRAVPNRRDEVSSERKPPVLVTVTPRGVVAGWGGYWWLLSPEDGSELARQPAADDDHQAARVVSVTDSERIYSYASLLSADEDRLVVRRLDDLSLIGTTESLPLGSADDQELLLAPGRLILYDGHAFGRASHLVGLEDGPPLDRP